MNLKEQAAILAAAIEGKPLRGQARYGGFPLRITPGPDLRFNFQDYTYEVADACPKALSIEAQTCILGAASIGKQIEAAYLPLSESSVWRPVSIPHSFDFTRFAYRIAKEKPKTRVLHQYIVRMTSGEYKTTVIFYANQEEVRLKTGYPDAQPATWTRIEVPA